MVCPRLLPKASGSCKKDAGDNAGAPERLGSPENTAMSKAESRGDLSNMTLLLIYVLLYTSTTPQDVSVSSNTTTHIKE